MQIFYQLPEDDAKSIIGVLPGENFFTSEDTERDNWTIKISLRYGDTSAIITSQIEHHAILNACHTVENFGYPVVYFPIDRNGIVSEHFMKTRG